MQLEISFRHMEASDRIKTFIHEKCEHLMKFFQGNLHLRWTLSQERGTHVAHVHATGRDIDFFVEDEEDNLLTLIEACVDKLEKQLQKKKEVLKDHHK